ncbi:MAG: hypothetical protein ACI92I_000705 [Acidimicrobiales bacterium]
MQVVNKYIGYDMKIICVLPSIIEALLYFTVPSQPVKGKITYKCLLKNLHFPTSLLILLQPEFRACTTMGTKFQTCFSGLFFLLARFIRDVFNVISIPMRSIREVRLDNENLKELIRDPNETNDSDMVFEFK